MIKFTMGSSSDAKKTPRRKTKRTNTTTAPSAPSSAAHKTSFLLGSNPGVTTTTSLQGAAAAAAGQTNGCLQTSVSSSASVNTMMAHSDSPSPLSYSQLQQQEVHSMQTSTSGREKDGELPSDMPFAKFYLDGESCFFCHRSKVGNTEVNLHQFIESESGADLSSFPQLWMCLECLDRRGINSVSADFNEEIVLDLPLIPTDEVSKVSPLDYNTCNCFSCAETRQIKDQNETFEQELQRYLYEDLRQLVAFVYQTSLSAFSTDVHEEYLMSLNSTKKLHNMMQKIYCRNPQRLFHCLESWAAALIMERRSTLCERLPAAFQQLTVSMASQLITSLLDEYSCFCIISQNLMSFFDSQENTMLKEFRLTLELHHKYLFHQLIFAQLQKYLTSAVTLISMQMMKLRKENAMTVNPHSQLLQKYAKFQDEMNRVLIHWSDYCQPVKTSKDDKKQWPENPKQMSKKVCETKTVPNVRNESHVCKCDMEKVLVCSGTDSVNGSKVVTFPGHHRQRSSCSQAVPFANKSPPSASKRSGSSSSECSSQDDTCQVLESFIPRSRSKLVNGEIKLRPKEEINKEDEEDNTEEHDDAIGASSRLIVSLCDHFSEDHLNTDEDGSNSDEDADDDADDDDDDDDDNEREETFESHEKKGFKNAASISNSALHLASDSSVPPTTNVITLCAAVSEATMTGTDASIPVSGVDAGASITNENLFVFGERSDVQATIIQPSLQCQCSSCISDSITPDLPRQSLMPPLSSLSIYPHIHGSPMSGLQQGQLVNHDASISQSRHQHSFQLQGQLGSGVDQLNSKTVNLKSNADVFPNKTLIPEWDMQNSFFLRQDNNYCKLATNGGPPLNTLSLVFGASEAQTIVDDGNIWLKVDQPNAITHSAILPQNGVTTLSPGLFKISANDLHLSQSLANGASIFPLNMPYTYAGIKGRIDQQPQYNFNQPVAVTTSASNMFTISSSYYQNTASPAMFVQMPTVGQAGGVSGTASSALCDISSCMKLPGELVANVCVNDSLLCGTGTKSTVASGEYTNVSKTDGSRAVDTGSYADAVDADGRAPLCVSSGISDVLSNMYSVIPENMEQFNIGEGAAIGSDHVNCTGARGNHVPLTFHHSLPLQRPGSGSQPSGCNEDQQSLTSCKTDSQQDEDDFNSQDESGSSSSNVKDGKFCDCWHCEVFGRSTPATISTSKNYPEMRDRLRLRLKKKQNEQKAMELEKTEELVDVSSPVAQRPVEQKASAMKDIEEVMKFINGEGEEDEKPHRDELIKSKKKAAKRSRQKQRKQQQKMTNEPLKPEMLTGDSENRHCDHNKQKIAMSSHFMPVCHPPGCCKSSVASSNSSLHNRSDCDNTKKAGNKVENRTLLNMLNVMKLSEKCVTNLEKSTAAAIQTNCEDEKNGIFKILERTENAHSSSLTTLLRQSAGHSCVLGKEENPHTSKAKARESSALVNETAKSEPKEDFRIEREMKPVTISSEDGVRTILASPLLQAELAKNKPLQKLFMQAVQQQQQSREKQEANATAEIESKSCQHSANHCDSAAVSLQSTATKANRQQQNSAVPKSSSGAATAGSGGVALEQKSTPSTEVKLMHHLLKNGTVTNKLCTSKMQQNQCQAMETAPRDQQNRTPSNVMSREKTQLSRTQPYTIPDEKLQDSVTQSSTTPSLRKTSLHNGKTCKASNAASSAPGVASQAVSSLTQCRHQELCRKDRPPSSGSLATNRLHPQTCNGFSSSVATSVTTVDPSSVKLEATVTEPTVSKVVNKQANKKTANSKKSKKSVLLSTHNEQLGVCLENGGETVKKVNSASNNESGSQKLKVPMNGNPEKQNYPSTPLSFADTELFASEGSEPFLCTKTKKNKKKSKSKGSLASVDEIFLPKNVPDDSHLNEHEREIEEFKRFCSNSAPCGNRQKVNLNNVKDMFNKKKVISAGYQ